MTTKEAVNWIINLSADIGKSEHRELWHYEQALYEIREMLESEQPKWIPVAERLPDSGGLYFVTFASGEVATAYFNDEIRRFSGFKDVKAWMPLPGPYRPEVEK